MLDREQPPHGQLVSIHDTFEPHAPTVLVEASYVCAHEKRRGGAQQATLAEWLEQAWSERACTHALPKFDDAGLF